MESSMRNMTKKIIFTFIKFISLVSISTGLLAAPLYYKFEGQVTGYSDQFSGITPSDYFSIGEQVTYYFLIDFSALGEHQQYDGDVFTLPDVYGPNDYFYAELLGDISSITLPEPTWPVLNNPNPENFDADNRYGVDFSVSDPTRDFGRIIANSYRNEFRVFLADGAGSLVRDWRVGDQVNAISSF